MIALRPHNANDYANLPDIDAAGTGALTEQDHACLDDAGECLVRSNSHQRFGVSLLHSHFPVKNDEMFVEEADPDNALVTLRPKRPISSYAASNMCFESDDEPSGAVRLVGLEFTSKAALCGVSPVDDADSRILASMREILTHHGKLRRFGIRLLHDPLKLNGRVLLETCDIANRILTCRITTTQDPNFRRSIPTMFSWTEVVDPSEIDPSVAQKCVRVCNTDVGCNPDPHSPGGHRGWIKHTGEHQKTC